MVSVGIIAFMLAGIYQVLIAGNKSWRLGSGLISLQENARSIALSLAKDIRQCTNTVSSTTLVNDGDGLTLTLPCVSCPGGSQAVRYVLSTIGATSVKQLRRSGVAVGSYINNIGITQSGSDILIAVNVQKNIPLQGVKTFSLTQRVELRND